MQQLAQVFCGRLVVERVFPIEILIYGFSHGFECPIGVTSIGVDDGVSEPTLRPTLPQHQKFSIKRLVIAQFMPGLPGLTVENDKAFIDDASENFDVHLLQFYEDYMAVTEGQKDLNDSRFVLSADNAKGFWVFMEHIASLPFTPVAVKGQITGPFTFCTGVHNQNKNAIFYNEQIRDAAVKLLALKAVWQVRQLSTFGCPVIIFFDEPALAGYGTSEYISVSSDEIACCLGEVIDAVRAEGGLAGGHVCANTDWSLI